MPKWIAIVLIAACLCGCVERRVYLISEPPGAEVYIDGELIGKTREPGHADGPLYANFVYYGAREFTFRKPGFTTVSTQQHLGAPWYEYPPIDFFAEVLMPWIIYDEHEVSAKLEPAQPAELEKLLERSEHFRRGVRPEDRYELRTVGTIQQFEAVKGQSKPPSK